GGLPMLDGGEADDKIIGVLAQDNIWSHVEDLDELPQALVQRLRHYFTTYKVMPGDTSQQVQIDHIYDRAHAEKVVRAAIADYEDEFGGA
ncbi:MAG: inorganic diphosphatase, partial [Planctomycetaceae bacterium]